MVLSDQSSVGQVLPNYTVTRFHIDEPEGSYDMYEVKCPRSGCGSSHWVPLSWRALREVEGAFGKPPARVYGRPCPHCSKASAIPPELRLAPSQPAKRRVVKRKKRT